LCIIAGDISPIDVISHLPVFCEEQDVPYIFVTSKVSFLSLHVHLAAAPPSISEIHVVSTKLQAELGASANTKRPTSCVLISPKDGFSFQSKFDKIVKDVVAMAPTY
jgi:H/ACA ribonucleoprotein complex subunit 2